MFDASFSIALQFLKMDMHQLVLQDITLDSSGKYKCQITESKPPFHTEQKERKLNVISKYVDGHLISTEHYRQSSSRMVPDHHTHPRLGMADTVEMAVNSIKYCMHDG